jgi:N-acetylglucosamine malate deacetylase 2
MSSEVMAWMSRVPGAPATGRSVLAVIAHPDEASFALGAILDAFILAGARVEVLCLTHGQAWTLHGAPGDLAALRGAELASAADVLGPTRAKMEDCPDGALGQVSPARLVAEVVAGAGSCFADVLLVFDAAAATGHLDHVTATSAALMASERLNLPVLGWALSKTAAAQLNQQPGGGFAGRQGADTDIRASLERARQRQASRDHSSQTLPGSAGRSQLELLAASHSVRWLRPPR